MALVRLSGYEGEAEVLGKLRRVRCTGDGEFTVYGMTLEEANTALGKLATGSFANLTVQQGQVTIALQRQADGALTPQQMDLIEELSATAKVDQPTAYNVLVAAGWDKAKAAAILLTQVKLAPPASATVPPAPLPHPRPVPVPLAVVPAPQAPPPQEVAPVEKAVPVPAAPVTPAAPKPAGDEPAASAAAGQAALPLPDTATDDVKALRDAKNLRNILVYFETRGVKGVDALVAACAAVQHEVPLLHRITNLEERVRRTYERMEIEGAEGGG